MLWEKVQDSWVFASSKSQRKVNSLTGVQGLQRDGKVEQISKKAAPGHTFPPYLLILFPSVQPATQDLESEPACDHLKGQATLRLGDRRLASFSTTQQSDYRLPTDTDRMDPPKRSLTEHNIIFNCPGRYGILWQEERLSPPPSLTKQLDSSSSAHPTC